MNFMNIILALTNIGAGLVVLLLSIPLMQGKVKRNWIYGVRTRATMASDEVWMQANRFWGQRAMIWCPVLIAAGILALFLPLGAGSPVLTIIVASAPVILLIPCIECMMHIHKINRT